MARGFFFHGLPLTKAVTGPRRLAIRVLESGWFVLGREGVAQHRDGLDRRRRMHGRDYGEHGRVMETFNGLEKRSWPLMNMDERG